MRLSDLYVVLSIVGIAVLVIGGISYLTGVRINTTKSIPVGIYQTSNRAIGKNSYVMFCPPQNDLFDVARKRDYIGAGFSPGGYGYMMKKILAAKNDIVTINENGVYINGALLPGSKPLKSDSADRAMPNYQIDNHLLSDNELLLMSDISNTSFDGRYFGFITRSQIKAVIHPVYTW